MPQILDPNNALEQHNATARRATWMALLSRAPPALRTHGLGSDATLPFEWLRKPQVGLMMMQARAGGTGERFNFGEITVTRCTLRLHTTQSLGTSNASDVAETPNTLVGVSYVLGRSQYLAQLAALADALLQDDARFEALNDQLLKPIAHHLSVAKAKRHAQAQSSRVEFFTVSRETGTDMSDEGDTE